MKTIYKSIKKKYLHSLRIEEYDILDNQNDCINLVETINLLSKGDEFYFRFFREEEDFLEDDEIIHYRKYIPDYFRKNGNYEIISFRDPSRFHSVAMLPAENTTSELLLLLWKYYWSIAFFSTSTKFRWRDFVYFSIENLRDIDGIKVLKSGYTNSIFIKGHDGDNLIFNYLESFELPDFNNQFIIKHR